MTRSLGDLEAHRETGLIADPEVSEHQVGWFKGDAMGGKPRKAMESNETLGYMAMDQYLYIPFLGG